MEISISYNKRKDEIKLILADVSLYEDVAIELEEVKESLNSDIEVDMVIDEIDETFVAKSRNTGNIFKGKYKYLDADEICYYFHEVAVMDNAITYIERFSTMKPITLDYSEEDNCDSDE